MKIIITGATGMVGEGVLLAALENQSVEKVLIINRNSYTLAHPKLEELIIKDFTNLEGHEAQISGYDACFFCAGVSSLGMSEEAYTKVTYDLTLSFARQMVALNPQMTFTYVSGMHTDSTEKGRSMWARVKGKTENDLMKLPFKAVYNFRPGVMTPVPGQKNIKLIFNILLPVVKVLMPKKQVLALEEVAQAMINAVSIGYPKSVLEIADIRTLAHAHVGLS